MASSFQIEQRISRNAAWKDTLEIHHNFAALSTTFQGLSFPIYKMVQFSQDHLVS